MAIFPFCRTKQENDWANSPNQGLPGYALAVFCVSQGHCGPLWAAGCCQLGAMNRNFGLSPVAHAAPAASDITNKKKERSK
jgi:hypothetical protein